MRERLRQVSSDLCFSSMPPPPGHIGLRFRHRHLEKLPAWLWIAQEPTWQQVPCFGAHPHPAAPHRCICLQDYSSAQYLHGITANAYIRNAFPFSRRTDIHFAWPTTLSALPNHRLLIIAREAVLDHPTSGAPCC